MAAAAVAASLLFLLFGPYSNFAPAGFLDPWYYTGYFTNFSYMMHHYGQTYFVSRLPWIIPGLLAFRVASPETASVLLNAAIVTVSLIALYWAVRWHYGRSPAVLVCCALLTNPYFMSTVGWDYPDGPAIAYAFAGLAFAVRPHGNPAWNTIRAAIFLTLRTHESCRRAHGHFDPGVRLLAPSANPSGVEVRCAAHRGGRGGHASGAVSGGAGAGG